MTIYFYKVGDPYGCFSNFSLHGVHLQEQYWPTVEHFYQAQKFVGTVDEGIVPAIRTATTAQEAAALGRDRSRVVRADWEVAKIPIMHEAVLIKFLTHADIQATLLATDDELLVEDSPTDYYWGCGADRTGQNHLGKILMRVRQCIRDLHP